MLKQRVITACIMVILLLLLLFLAPPVLFQSAIVLLCALAAWEWTCLAAFSSVLGRVLYVLVLTLALVALSTVTYPALVAIILAPAVLGWCIALGLVLTYPAYRQWCQRRGRANTRARRVHVLPLAKCACLNKTRARRL